MSERDNSEAQFKFGLNFYNGDGVTEDKSEAAKWFRLAAEQNHAPAQYHLGLQYDNGWGVTEDRAEAAVWYRLAAEQNHEDALEALEKLQKDPGEDPVVVIDKPAMAKINRRVGEKNDRWFRTEVSRTDLPLLGFSCHACGHCCVVDTDCYSCGSHDGFELSRYKRSMRCQQCERGYSSYHCPKCGRKNSVGSLVAVDEYDTDDDPQPSAKEQSTSIAEEILYARDRWKWRTVFLVLWSLVIVAIAYVSFNPFLKYEPSGVLGEFPSAAEIEERQQSNNTSCVILVALLGPSFVITPSLLVRSANKPSIQQAREFGRRFTLTQLKCIRVEIRKRRPISGFMGLLVVTAPVIIVDQYRFSSRARKIINAL